MAEALVEAGVGATRALVVEAGEVVEAWLEPDEGLRAGTMGRARLTRILVPGRRGVVMLDGEAALLEPLPPGLAEGGLVAVEVMREAVPEVGRARFPKARAVAHERLVDGTDGFLPMTSTLAERLAARGLAVRHASPRDGALDAAGWPEAAEVAESGTLAFPGGLLTLSPTPAMTVIDVDGPGDLAALAEAAARAVARAVRLLDLAGSLGIDFPTLADRAARARLGAILDAHLPPPFERTAVNGFGFAQIVRPKSRASLLDRARGDPVGWAALALLRAAERATGAGPCTLTAAPPVIAWLESRPRLATELARRLGGPVALRADPALPISAGHVQRATP